MSDKNNSNGRLAGKTALITGAAQGLGLGIAQRFAEEGAKVILADLDADTLNERAAEIGNGAVGMRLDVTSQSEWEAAFQKVEADGGQIDVLVNNAGVHTLAPFEQMTIDEWRRVLSINLDGTFIGCQCAVQHMKANGGSIINMASVAGLRGNSQGAAYGASKAAVLNLSRSIAVTCGQAGYKIRCNAILPGITRTPMMDEAPKEMTSMIEANTPTGRMGEPLDIANAALYLASEEAAQVNGAELIVDGGLVA